MVGRIFALCFFFFFHLTVYYSGNQYISIHKDLPFLRFIYFWMYLVFVAVHGLFSNCSTQGLLSHCDAWASHCVASLVVERGL